MTTERDGQPVPHHEIKGAARLIEQELRDVGSIGQYEFASRMQVAHGITADVYAAATRILFPRLGVTRQGEMLIVPSFGTFPIGIDPTPYQQDVREIPNGADRGFMATMRRIAQRR